MSWMAGAGSLGCVAAALRHSVAVRGRRRLCACAPVWHTLGAGLVLLSGVLYVLYDVLLLLLCWFGAARSCKPRPRVLSLGVKETPGATLLCGGGLAGSKSAIACDAGAC